MDLLETIEAQVQSAADQRYDQFVEQLLDSLEELSPQESQQLLFLLRNRGGLPKLRILRMWSCRIKELEYAELLDRMLALRRKAGLTDDGGGLHRLLEIPSRVRQEMIDELTKITITMQEKLYGYRRRYPINRWDARFLQHKMHDFCSIKN